MDRAQSQLLEKIKKIPPAYQQEVEDLSKTTQRKVKLLKGKLQMADDFDAPLDFKTLDFPGLPNQ
ncbi:MAG: hypothetical protein EAS52_06495 [Parapedobacter sp.]|nr:MAG: hypothetical protein EAS52_06495 [Parapedobacter sp.]